MIAMQAIEAMQDGNAARPEAIGLSNLHLGNYYPIATVQWLCNYYLRVGILSPIGYTHTNIVVRP